MRPEELPNMPNVGIFTAPESPQAAPTIGEALQNALDFIEGLGYTSGDVHDDLAIAIRTLKRQCKDWMNTEV